MIALEWPDEEPDEEAELGPTPRQEPKLSDPEATLFRARDTRQARIEWLMAPEAPEIQSLLDLFERPAWHRQAACRGQDVSTFFPERGDKPTEALAYCEGCPVRQEWLASALELGSTTPGVWGGTSGRVRKGLRRSVA